MDTAKRALWVMEVTADAVKTPVRLTSEAFNARNGAFSPDGKWIAYDSDMSGASEIYVQAFSTTTAAGRQKISSAGGIIPHWRGDGEELFYLTSDRSKLMVARVKTRGGFSPGQPGPLFDLPFTSIRNDFIVTKSGQRFLIPAPLTPTLSTPATVVLNWTSLLR